tara:strand:- start:196 stop:1116 length:921 start_codon:yes stop_codon:yes gene_type:complete
MLKVERFFAQPIIFPHMDKKMGDNINGPSIIQMPKWAKKKLGAYHLYFSDHKGSYIRLAFSDSITGPWKTYDIGALELSESLFITEQPSDKTLYAHIASPDVHIDYEKKCFWMYFHGQLDNGEQVTRVAVSNDGLSFTVKAPILGPPYFRAFEYHNWIYAICWGGEIWRSKDWWSPFEKGPLILPFNDKNIKLPSFRHGEVFLRDSVLHIFFSNIGDQPEKILHTTINILSDWKDWKVGLINTILEPELAWEGVGQPLLKSVVGAAETRVRELRDPCVFEDFDEQVYLFYSGSGEGGIGVVKLFDI